MNPSPRPLRIPPVSSDERHSVAELLDPIQVDGQDLNIFATLVRHPRLFKRWSDFGGYLLYRGKLTARDRELLILRTGWNCQADYEWGQHVRIALHSGVSEAEITRVIDGPDEPGWSATES